MSNYLYHHGVKGMKWGHRKTKIKNAISKRKQEKTKKAISEEKKRLNGLNAKYKNELQKAQKSNNQYLIKVKKAQIEITNNILKDIGNMKVSDINAREVRGKVFWSTSKHIEDVSNRRKLSSDERWGVLKA